MRDGELTPLFFFPLRTLRETLWSKRQLDMRSGQPKCFLEQRETLDYPHVLWRTVFGEYMVETVIFYSHLQKFFNHFGDLLFYYFLILKNLWNHKFTSCWMSFSSVIASSSHLTPMTRGHNEKGLLLLKLLHFGPVVASRWSSRQPHIQHVALSMPQ